MESPGVHKQSDLGVLTGSTTASPFLAYGAVLVGLAAYLVCVGYDVAFFYFLTVFGILVLITALVNFEAAFIYIPLTLTNPYTLSETGTNLHLSEFVLLIIIAVWAVRVLPFQGEYNVHKQFLIPAILVVIASILSLSVARHLAAGVQQVVRYIEVLLILFFIITNNLKSERRINQVFLALMIGGLLASLLGLGQFITGTLTKGETRRIFGWHGGGYGALIASTLLLSVSALLYARDRTHKLWAMIIIPCAGLALVLSQTRAWIAAYIAVLMFVLLWSKRKIIGKVLFIFGFLILTVVIILRTNVFGLVEENLLNAALESAFRFGMTPGKRSLEDLSLFLRLNVWRRAVTLFFSNPLLGIGVGNLRIADYFTARLGEPAEGVGYIDNQYIQFFTEAGVVAGIAWIVFVIRALRSGASSVRSATGSNLHAAAMGFYASFLVFVVGSFFWVITPHHELFAIMILDIALLLNIARLKMNPGAEQT